MGIFKRSTVSAVLGLDATIVKLERVITEHTALAIKLNEESLQLLRWLDELAKQEEAARTEVRGAESVISDIKNMQHNYATVFAA